MPSLYSDRIISPRETLSRVEPFLTRFGITRVARHTGLDDIGIPVWCAYTPNSRSIVIAQAPNERAKAAKSGFLRFVADTRCG